MNFELDALEISLEQRINCIRMFSYARSFACMRFVFVGSRRSENNKIKIKRETMLLSGVCVGMSGVGIVTAPTEMWLTNFCVDKRFGKCLRCAS